MAIKAKSDHWSPKCCSVHLREAVWLLRKHLDYGFGNDFVSRDLDYSYRYNGYVHLTFCPSSAYVDRQIF